MTTGKRRYSPEALEAVSAASRERILRVKPWERHSYGGPAARVARSRSLRQHGADSLGVAAAARYIAAVLKALRGLG